jgi:hypothetical protein
MGDRTAERAIRSPFWIHVDPLVVARRVSEEVHLVLIHLMPIGPAEMLALQVPQSL